MDQSGTPSAIETEFGWVLVGNTDDLYTPDIHMVACHSMPEGDDDILRSFGRWKKPQPALCQYPLMNIW